MKTWEFAGSLVAGLSKLRTMAVGSVRCANDVEVREIRGERGVYEVYGMDCDERSGEPEPGAVVVGEGTVLKFVFGLV
ncbi:hypothetical protein [Streptomyces sp. Ag109_O5-1]|uniref:hypothetical protein n=1 Tax=Streptomyces sp. Ag109_O5-1 TaxID=1938851 RepID=UPI000F4FF171|nr:hypothetical protein [Streptomyces sp. Ag109_O5-1]